jgi:hypothetical protein
VVALVLADLALADLVLADLALADLVLADLALADLVLADLALADLVMVGWVKISTQIMVGWAKIKAKVEDLGILSFQMPHHLLMHGIKCNAQNVTPLHVEMIHHWRHDVQQNVA